MLVLWTDGSKFDLPAVALHRLSSFYFLCNTFEDVPETQIARGASTVSLACFFLNGISTCGGLLFFIRDIRGAAYMLTINWRDEKIVKYVGCLWMVSSSVLRKIR